MEIDGQQIFLGGELSLLRGGVLVLNNGCRGRLRRRCSEWYRDEGDSCLHLRWPVDGGVRPQGPRCGHGGAGV